MLLIMYIYILEITVFNLIGLALNSSNYITYYITIPRGLLVIILIIKYSYI